jgi:hypothetical protein
MLIAVRPLISLSLEFCYISARTPTSTKWRFGGDPKIFCFPTKCYTDTKMAYYTSGQWPAVQTSTWPGPAPYHDWENSAKNGSSPESSSVSLPTQAKEHELRPPSQTLLHRATTNRWMRQTWVPTLPHPIPNKELLQAQPITPTTQKYHQFPTSQQQPTTSRTTPPGTPPLTAHQRSPLPLSITRNPYTKMTKASTT